jgi:hypothetical protein
MVNADPNIEDVADTKKLNQTKEGNYDNVRKPKKVQFISKLFIKI